MNRDEISNGLTAFIDILGFSEKVKQTKSLEEIFEIKNQIQKIQDIFEHNATQGSVYESHKALNKSVLAFSDCIAIHVPFKSDATDVSGTFDPFMLEFIGLALSQGQSVFNSIFIRGGIDIGWWYHSGSTLISNGLVNSVKREAAAVVPVIALCDDLYDFFCKHEDRKCFDEARDPIKAMFREYNSGREHFFYLDYIFICLDNLMGSRINNTLFDPESWLYDHARVIEKVAKEAPNEHVFRKYQWLANYHNEVAEDFTDKERCFCKV
ncbi:MAG: hypothetical protein Q7U57_04695 [Methylovulum sp.]|nr:hypothetical protein [Methylovulum sp.]